MQGVQENSSIKLSRDRLSIDTKDGINTMHAKRKIGQDRP